MEMFNDNVGAVFFRWIKNTARINFWFIACFISVMITQIVHFCFVGIALLLLDMALRSVLVEFPWSILSLKTATAVGQREQAGKP